MAVGREGTSPTAELVADYTKRAADLGKGLGVAVDLPSIVEAPKALSGGARQQKEAALLAAALPGGGPVVLLDERGDDMTSRAFAETISRSRDDGVPGMTFVIGGADGFAPEFMSAIAGRQVRQVRFGRVTWPHLFVRAMVAEQIYRSLTLMAGHPYHRD